MKCMEGCELTPQFQNILHHYAITMLYWANEHTTQELTGTVLSARSHDDKYTMLKCTTWIKTEQNGHTFTAKYEEDHALC